MSNYRFLFIAVLAFSITVTGCDSNDDSDDGTEAFEAMGEMMSSSFAALGFIASEIFLGQVSKSQPSYSCPNSGSIEYTESATNANIYTLDFQDCDGTNGSIDLGLNVETTQSSFNFSLILDGSLVNQCTLTYSNFTQNVVSNITDGTQSILINGAVGASCGGQSYACAFDNSELTFTDGEGDSDLYENNCALSN